MGAVSGFSLVFTMLTMVFSLSIVGNCDQCIKHSALQQLLLVYHHFKYFQGKFID